jgi:hypothetical protein
MWVKIGEALGFSVSIRTQTMIIFPPVMVNCMEGELKNANGFLPMHESS